MTRPKWHTLMEVCTFSAEGVNFTATITLTGGEYHWRLEGGDGSVRTGKTKTKRAARAACFREAWFDAYFLNLVRIGVRVRPKMGQGSKP